MDSAVHSALEEISSEAANGLQPSAARTNGTATETQRSILEATSEAPSDGRIQSSKGSGSFDPVDTADAYDNSESNGKQSICVPGEEDTSNSVFQESHAYDAVLSNKSNMGVREIGEQIALKEQEEEQLQCLDKNWLEIQVIDDTTLIEPSLHENGKFDNDQEVGTKRNSKQQETEEKKEKKSRRRGGKARKNKDILNYYSSEKVEKKGLQYSKQEMEALRFEKLEEQKKKWIEVYCGLGQLVAQEYDGLVQIQLDKTHQKLNGPSIDFDPRAQFQKTANLGEDSLQSADDHFESLGTPNPDTVLPISDEMGCSIVEGECSQDDESDEDYSSIQRPAFVVSGEPDFDSGPPQDGLEYLRRVRWEAARIPKVAVAKVNNKIKEQTVYMPQIPDIVKCPENLLPLKQWEDSFLADFSELRQAFMQLDLEGSSPKSPIKLHEKDILSQMLENNSSEKISSSTPPDDSCPSEASCKSSNITIDTPTLSTILKMDSATRTSALKKRISSIGNMSELRRSDGLWLFALCVALDCPLHADTSAALRSLLRKCASLRAMKTELDDEVVMLNILATITGKYFGQLEK